MFGALLRPIVRVTGSRPESDEDPPVQGASVSRKVADCRAFPNEAGCTLTISGQEEEVLDAALEHAVSRHGQSSSPELREQLRGVLTAEPPSTMSPADERKRQSWEERRP
jgi:hypothetical protein